MNCGRLSVSCNLEPHAPRMFYPLFCTSFCDKNGKLADNHRFLLQTKRKAADKALEQCFLKEFKAMCKNSDESELKQKKAI